MITITRCFQNAAALAVLCCALAWSITVGLLHPHLHFFPLLNSSLGASGTFWLYGVICALGGAFIAKNLPETKGKTLEEIENDLAGNL